MIFIRGFVFALASAVTLAQNPITVQTDYEALVAAERAFAQAALDRGIRDAFVSNLDAQSVVFQNGRFLPGKATYERQPEGPGKLTWRPTYAEIANSGDLGFTTGPFEFRPRALSDEPVAYGQFTSVWHKTATGTWKALIDFGCTHTRPDQPLTSLQSPSHFNRKSTAALDTAQQNRELMQTEQAFAQAARQKSLSDAYQTVLPASDSLRLLREGAMPSFGQAARKLAMASTQQIDYQPLQGITAASGDLGYTYGYATAGSVRQGYLRIWRKRNGRWQLAHEVLALRLS